MTIYCQFTSQREACYSLGDVAKRMGIKLIARPYNRFQPEDSPWWLVSFPDEPAYRYIKFSFDEIHGINDSLFCSVYIEKGIGREISELYTSTKGKKSIMTPEWAWYWFLNNLKNGKVASTITKLSSDLNLPINIQIDTSYFVDSPSWDPHESNLSRNSYLFQLEPGSGALVIKGLNASARIKDGLALKQAQIKSMEDLALLLSRMSDNPWLWVDIMIGLSFNYNPPSGTPLELNWNADTIWVKYFSKFQDWLTARVNNPC